VAHWPWIDRSFRFDYPVGKFPDLLERVRGTPARLEERLRDVGEPVLMGTDGAGWSIKQNVGHLTDVEPLHLRRLEQILAGENVLVAADMTNQRTIVARYNARPLQELLVELRRVRGALVARFEAVAEADWGRAALHPRLQQPMRIVDILYFTAEHDDYHLARIAQLLRALQPVR
jgi:uncharacterized damage-inducible protein DinB